MKLLFLDFETQTLDATTTNITEIGAILGTYDPEKRTWVEEEAMSQLVWASSYPPQTEEVVEVTGITDQLLMQSGIKCEHALEKLYPWLKEVDYALAHNVSFDKTVLDSVSKRLGFTVPTPKNGWLCTIQDMPWPKKFKCKKLSHLAYDHGIIAPQKDLHRAIVDVRLLAQLILGNYKIEEIVERRDSPWIYLRADIPGPWVGNGGDGGIGKAQATKLGYSWERVFGTQEPIFPKFWVKRVKSKEVEKEKLAPFRVIELEGIK